MGMLFDVPPRNRGADLRAGRARRCRRATCRARSPRPPSAFPSAPPPLAAQGPLARGRLGPDLRRSLACATRKIEPPSLGGDPHAAVRSRARSCCPRRRRRFQLGRPRLRCRPPAGLRQRHHTSPWWSRLIPRDEVERGRDHVGRSARVRPQRGTPFAMSREILLSPLGIPCNPPPWGTLAAVDMSAGEIRWQVPLGTTRDMAPWPWLTIRHAKHGRADRDRYRAGVHRRGHRQLSARLLRRDRRGAVARPPARRAVRRRR